MPRSSSRRAPSRSSKAASSCGRTNLSHECVPGAAMPSTRSAATIASAQAAGVRFSVDTTTDPPGRVNPTSVDTNVGTQATCSTTSRETTASKERPCSRRLSADPAMYVRRGPATGSRAAWLRAISTERSAASTPVTVAPSRASGSESRPPPQPTSSTSKPLSGSTTDAPSLVPHCLAIASRTNATLAGFIACKGASGPLASHH
mmetsp:Transcript_22620/g.73534  ORF Transcript_22620/g.73534 Transcript_22620/m.73534 type:complete len:204 (-) Transcript_22620:154-765(-)